MTKEQMENEVKSLKMLNELLKQYFGIFKLITEVVY